MSISGVVVARNEEKNIKRCLESLNFCDEIILVDDYSNDTTIQIAKKNKARIFKRKLNGDFSAQRNFGLEKCKSDWIFFLDADEEVSRYLAEEIAQTAKKNDSQIVAYKFKRHDILWGKTVSHGEIGSQRLVRLVRKNSGKWMRKVHEKWEVKGSIGIIKNPVLHYPHQRVTEFIADVEWMSSIHASENSGEGKRSSIFKIIFMPILKFVDGYFLKFGFLDSLPGLVVALIMSFHSYLAWSKLWLLQRQNS